MRCSFTIFHLFSSKAKKLQCVKCWHFWCRPSKSSLLQV